MQAELIGLDSERCHLDCGIDQKIGRVGIPAHTQLVDVDRTEAAMESDPNGRCRSAELNLEASIEIRGRNVDGGIDGFGVVV